MRQILQNLKTGNTELVDVPAPLCKPGQALIAARYSLISAGTERMLVEFSQANWIEKARSQPDKVKQVLEKIRTDGLLPTLETVFARLDQPLPLGYCHSGVVVEAGNGVSGFQTGDRVISNGPHAEVICVPQNLCARIPDDVGDDVAAFTPLAAVSLQGIRLANPTLGENIVVSGLGLLGLIAVQMLVASGCRVLGIDFDPKRLALARQFGAEIVDLSAGADPIAAGLAFSNGRGVDAVLITASTKSSDVVHQAAQMSRKRGRIILVGVVGLELSRADFYEKELTFQVSCSYGPGRYDENYEQRGHDYPYGLVRWTEKRNFEAVLALMAAGKLNVSALISHRVPFSQASEAYRALMEDRSALGVLLSYSPESLDLRKTISTPAVFINKSAEQVTAGVIGAGNFASLVLLPALAKTPAKLKSIAGGNDTTAALAARKFGFQQSTTDYHIVLSDPEVNTVFIATPHHLHSGMVIEALRAGKHVFVEKPLALNEGELSAVGEALHQTRDLQLMVGFNRRFSPLAQSLSKILAARSQPVNIVYVINAGAIPATHWTQDPLVGGGRIIGEACHFIDLIRYLVGAAIIGLEARMMGAAPGIAIRQDKMTIMLEFADGSTGAVHYLANGSKSFPKEHLEVFSEGRVAVLDNFKSLRAFGWKGFKNQTLTRQDKGHRAEVAAFVQRVLTGGSPLIAWDEIEEVTLATFRAVERAQQPPRGLKI